MLISIVGAYTLFFTIGHVPKQLQYNMIIPKLPTKFNHPFSYLCVIVLLLDLCIFKLTCPFSSRLIAPDDNLISEDICDDKSINFVLPLLQRECGFSHIQVVAGALSIYVIPSQP